MKNEIITEGYKLNNYDATYEKTTFLIRTRHENNKKVIREVTELNSGMTFIYEERRKKACTEEG